MSCGISFVIPGETFLTFLLLCNLFSMVGAIIVDKIAITKVVVVMAVVMIMIMMVIAFWLHCFVAGFMKAASSFLYESIIRHPQVLHALRGVRFKGTYCGAVSRMPSYHPPHPTPLYTSSVRDSMIFISPV
jgi:uncharacterized membrane protein YjgN (DUF898 family)